MFKAVNIGKFFRALILIALVCFLVTACSSESGGEPSTNTPLGDSQGQTASSIVAEQRNCWQSSILELMYNQMGIFAMGMYKQICDGSMALVLMGFCIWLSLRLMRHVSSFQEENIGETWTEILKQLFLCLVCGIIANSSDNIIWVLNHIIFPLFYAFLEFGSEMLNVGVSGIDNTVDLWFLGEKTVFDKSITCSAGNLVVSDNSDTFPQAPLQLLSCLSCAINDRLGAGLTPVVYTLTQGGFMAMIIGCVIYIIFWFVKISFIFYIVDSLFRFTIMVGLLPILVMAYAFQRTRSLTKSGFITMLASAGYMMMIAFTIAVCLLALQTFMQLPELGLNSQNPQAYEADFKTFSVAVMCLLLMAFLCASTMSIAKELTNEFIGNSGDDNFQKKAGKLVAMIAKGVLLWLTAGTANLLLKIKKLKKMKDKYDQVRGNIAGKLNSLAGRGK